MDNMKQCGNCGRWLPKTGEYFGRKGNGLKSACKDCCREQKRLWRLANPDKRRAEKQRYNDRYPGRESERKKGYVRKNPEQERLRRQQRRRQNIEKYSAREHLYRVTHRERRRIERREYTKRYPEKERERKRLYRVLHPDKVRDSNRKYRQEHPESRRLADHNRRARLMNAEGRHTGADLKRQYESQKGRCYYCGVKVGDDWHADHVVPLSRGGTNWPDNIVITCPTCNMSKHDKLPHEWVDGGRLL